MTPLDSFLTITTNELTGSTELPDTPWIRLADLECFIIGMKLIPIDEGQGSVFSDLSRWICAAGFYGARFVGRPAKAHSVEVTGPMQEIPTIFFRKERGCYGEHGISRVDWDADDSVILKEQRATAAYRNRAGELVIRQRASWDEEQDTFLFLSPPRMKSRLWKRSPSAPKSRR
jgi:hypothetical protein